MVTSGSMSGEGKRSDGLLGESDYERRRSLQAPPALHATALLFDSTHRLRESRRSVRRLPVGLVCRQARLCPMRDASDFCGRSRQPNTHSTELRELRYPWHPWFGRAVTIYEVLVKQGHSVSRCGLEEERHRLSLEVPTWMFEPAACGRLRVMAVPAVNCDALRALQTLLRTTARSDPGDVARSAASFLACRRRC